MLSSHSLRYLLSLPVPTIHGISSLLPTIIPVSLTLATMASLNSLPLEILGMIFKNFDRIETLSSAILVCRHLCASFRAASRVPEVVLYRQIPPTVLPYAIA
ncbi:hypothetical protein B0J18DRAFT_467346 [Chaetomium sp. MPI-SDFR-AT-0129]|nr:hypothetical protein B0J18DRAFT_467346 [Chaetomium sp. MPI-SDFR-AT-0129]